MEITEAKKLFRETILLIKAYSHAMGIMFYDQETAAPKNAADGVGRTLSILTEKIYTMTVNPKNFEVIDTLMSHKDELDFITKRDVEEVAHDLSQMRKIPVEKYTAFQVLLTEARGKWVEAKRSSDYSIFEPYLEKIVEYNKEFAALINPDIAPYDYWLNEYERGASIKMLDEYFDRLRSAIVPLIGKITAKGNRADFSFLEKNYPIVDQRRLSNYLMEVMKINRDDCAIGEVEHPFTDGFNKHDVRITTHYYENMFASSMYSVIHEGGHALYELNIGDDLADTGLAGGASMGIHEAQSRFYENIIGRSRAFIDLIFGRLSEMFPEQLKGVDAEKFYLAVNRTQPSLIRTEADELTYSMHIIVRYEIEKALMNGSISTKELPAEWNRLYKEYLGIDVPNDREGVLQDSHWSGGSIGYFPSYSLGSAYGAQIFHYMKKELDVEKLISENKIDVITAWLTEKIYKYGKLLTPAELIRNCCGEDFNPDYYIEYLTKKYSKIYGLTE